MNINITETEKIIRKLVSGDPALIAALQSLIASGDRSKMDGAFPVLSYQEKQALNERFKPLPSVPSFFQKSRLKRSNPVIGIAGDKMELPSIPRGSTVLDVGAGDGFIARQIRDDLGCKVYALEPSLDRSTDFETCQKRLGKDHVKKLTLQEALLKHRDNYFQKFDVVVVFRYKERA